MARLVFSGCALLLAYVFLSHIGSPGAAVWLTGGLAVLAAIWFGLAKA
jgi:hypothetical protein